MKASEIDLLGERFYLSVNSPENKPKESRQGTNITLKYDAPYPLSFFCRGDKGTVDGYTAALCATAFLKERIGADSTEFTFHTRSGNVKVLCTDSGMYTLILKKCKLLYTKMAEALGCAAEYSDILIGEVIIRTVRTKDISFFNKSAFYPFITYGDITPSAIVAAERTGSVISALGYTDFSANPPTRLFFYTAAACAEGTKLGERLFTPDGRAVFSISDSSVTLSLSPPRLEI